MPGHQHGSSVKKPSMYEKLRAKGMGKSKAARISNAAAAGTLSRGGKRGGGKRRR